jgi:glycosyltransferase involved in cell wall biosynthesis
MSENEGLPLVILEAMSKGKLVITTNVGFIKEALGDDYPYYVANDADSLKEAILSIENLSKVEYEALTNTLKDRFDRGFSLNTRLAKLKTLFLNNKR